MKHRLRNRFDLAGKFASSLKDPDKEDYVLRLYVAGMSARSAKTFANVRNVCEKYLHGRFEVEVVDIYDDAHSSLNDQILVSPMLVRKQPAPVRRIVGDLSEEDRIVIALDLGREK